MADRSSRDRPGMSRTISLLAVVLMTAQPPGSAHAHEDPSGGTREPERHALIGARAVMGYVFEEQRERPGGGGGISIAIPFARERWEFEGVVSLIKLRGLTPLSLLDVGIKRNFELRRSVSPHLAFGPALSIDVGSETRVTAGMLASVGINWFPRQGPGLLADLAYRLMGSDEGLEHVLSLSIGIGLWL
jgi:hypothetical protein